MKNKINQVKNNFNKYIAYCGTGCARGFTVMELLIVIAIVGVIAVFTTAVDTNSIHRTNVVSERTTLVELLMRARNQSMNNMYGDTHGVRVTDTDFVLFSGSDYDHAATTTLIKRNTQITGGEDSEVVFTQLTGTTTGTTNISLTGPAKSETLTINSEGMITW